MSNSVYPSASALPGLGFNVGKSPSFNTLVQRSASAREARVGLQSYPLWDFDLKYNFLRDTATFPELKTLGAFFLTHFGALDSWLFTDPDDSSVTNQVIGTGNASNRDFQLLRSFGGFLEPVFYPNSITSVRVNGTPLGYVDLGNGVVRMNTAPANGATVDWNGTYYFRCRFAEDKMDLDKFMDKLWQAGRVSFIGSLQDKLL